MESNNYYEKLIEQIEKLIKNNEIKEAKKLIEIEFSLPYIPIDYEEKLKKIYENIKGEKLQKNSRFSREEIIELMSDKSVSNEFKLNIAHSFFEFNWKKYEIDIDKLFQLPFLEMKVKAIIFDTLISQKIDYLFVIGGLKLNPKNCTSLFDTPFAILNFNTIENDAENEPIIRDIAMKSLVLYLLNAFPKSLFFEENDITKHLFKISNVMLGNLQVEKLNKDEVSIYNIIKMN